MIIFYHFFLGRGILFIRFVERFAPRKTYNLFYTPTLTMFTFYLPTMAFFREDVETMADLLSDVVPPHHRIGLEVRGKPEHFQSQKAMTTIEGNLGGLKGRSRPLSLIIHGFSGPAVYEGRAADMRGNSGIVTLADYIGLAQKVGANYVHVHG